jgi:hypothetical protein
MFYRDWEYNDGALTPVNVDRYLAWSPDGTTIAVFSEDTYDPLPAGGLTPDCLRQRPARGLARRSAGKI